MAKMMNMMKQVKQVKKMQKALAAKTVEARSRDDLITVVARGDMTIKSVVIKPDAFKDMRPERFEKMLVSTINSALDSSKKAAAGDMSKLGDLSALSEMMGG